LLYQFGRAAVVSDNKIDNLKIGLPKFARNSASERVPRLLTSIWQTSTTTGAGIKISSARDLSSSAHSS
jgi:hypothetical protein